MAKSRLHELVEHGQSIWYDTLSRDLVHSGELKRMMDEDAVTGVTSNPTIFQKALSSGDSYDEDMKKLLTETDDPEQIFFSLALQDIRDACDVLKPAYDASNGVDGYVTSTNPITPTPAFTNSVWFNTTTERGGAILGFSELLFYGRVAASSPERRAKKMPSRVIESTRPAASPRSIQRSPDDCSSASACSPSDGIGHPYRIGSAPGGRR